MPFYEPTFCNFLSIKPRAKLATAPVCTPSEWCPCDRGLCVKEASACTKRMVQDKRVRLEFDPANAHLGHKDRYRRTLAYVFLEDGTFLNAEIIKKGFGFAYKRFPGAVIVLGNIPLLLLTPTGWKHTS